ncbi:MAG: MBL fold metallo-hydrolase [Lachnospiraceae bacterium]|nr:MBL fold metallo-hydrolase [Lachnospiraceae bacterium]
MKVTFIDHSGYLVELEHSVLLFDYYRGEIPEIAGKKWYVFVSHFHQDHYNPVIFDLRRRGEDVTYILSKDVKKYRRRTLKEPYEIVSWNESYRIEDIFVDTFQSTDEGCAFLVHAEGLDIFHAGDLNWWHWIGEPESDNEAMKTGYIRQIAKLEHENIDLAFMLLDPRQEGAYAWGMNYFMEHTRAKMVFPMHMWGAYALCDAYLQTECGRKYKNRFQKISHEGETFVFSDID